MYKIILISLAAWLYPYYFDKGMYVKYPIAIVVRNRAEADTVVKMFPLGSERISSTTTKEQTVDILTSANSNAVFVFPQLPGGRKTRSVKHEHNCELSYDAAISHMIGDDPVIALILFVFEKQLPDEYKDSVLEVHLSKEDIKFNFNWNFLPDEKDLSLIDDKYREIKDKEPDFEWLYMAAACMYVVLRNMGKLDEYPKVLNDVNELIFEFTDTDWIVQEASYCLMNYIKSEGSAKIYHLGNLPVDIEDKMNNSIFFNSTDMYIHSDLLEKIFAPILEYSKISIVKKILAKNLIIISDDSCYSAKMNYHVGKKLKRIRMVKFNMTMVGDENGTLEDLINSIIY